tara:strand:+ start:317 stop:541 length:225 start_codon:yes stop_codon:yes gene_type:complete
LFLVLVATFVEVVMVVVLLIMLNTKHKPLGVEEEDQTQVPHKQRREEIILVVEEVLIQLICLPLIAQEKLAEKV